MSSYLRQGWGFGTKAVEEAKINRKNIRESINAEYSKGKGKVHAGMNARLAAPKVAKAGARAAAGVGLTAAGYKVGTKGIQKKNNNA